MPISAFDVERVRMEAARSLPPDCFDDFQRLTRSLLHGPAFQWLLVDATDNGLRRDVMGAVDRVLAAAGLAVNRLPLGRGVADVAALEARLIKNANRAAVVHVVGVRGWFDSGRWEAFNVRRERIAAAARARLVFWLDAGTIAQIAQGAPDLWSWRSGVYAFTAAAVEPIEPFVPDLAAMPGVDPRSMTEKSRRIAHIRAWIAAHPDAPDELLVAPYDELGRLLFGLGEYDAALAHWRELELPLHVRRGDGRSAAITQCQIADVLQARGDSDQALRILREQLPAYEALGDEREIAVTRSEIAHVLQSRGDADEALDMMLGALPVFERLGDRRETAVALARLADLRGARGETDEALRIYRDEVVPLCENQRDRAVAMGRIARIMEARGDLDEALRIHREEELPVYERSGDRRELANAWARIGRLLFRRGDTEEGSRLLRQSYATLQAMRLPGADQVAAVMASLGIALPDSPSRPP